MSYSVLYFTPSTEKNDSCLKDGPLGSYLCDFTLLALSIRCQFLFCGQENKQRIFLWVKEIYIFFFFLRLTVLIFVFLMFLCHSFHHISYSLCKSFFGFVISLIACPCHEFFKPFMKIVCGSCGHIKVRWDNHLNCLKCSSCSRLSACSTCSNWSESTWILADKRRTYSNTKSVMKKKHKKEEQQTVISVLSDNNSVDGMTIPQGSTARERTYPDGIFMGAIGTQKTLPTSHQSPGTGQPGTGQPVTGQPVSGQPVTGKEFTSQPGTGQPGTSQPGTSHLMPGIRHWSSVIQSPVIGN